MYAKSLQVSLIFLALFVRAEVTRAAGEDTDKPGPTLGQLSFDLPPQPDPDNASGTLHGQVRATWVTLPSVEDAIKAAGSAADDPPANPAPDGPQTAAPTLILAPTEPGPLAQAEKLAASLRQKHLDPQIVPLQPGFPENLLDPPKEMAGDSLWVKAYRATVGKLVERAKSAYAKPNRMEVGMGVVSGGYRLATASPVYFSLGLNPVAAGLIVAIVTARTAIRDIYIRTVDNFYSRKRGVVAPHTPPGISENDLLPDRLRENLDTEKTHPPPAASWRQSWTRLKEKAAKVKEKAIDVGERSMENLFFLELVRTVGTLGGAPGDRMPSVFTGLGQVDILASVLGPGLTGSILGAARSHSLKTPEARAWWNFNTFLANAIFQNLIWAGLGGPVLFHLGIVPISTVLALNMAHDILLAALIKKFPRSFEKIAQVQANAFNYLKEKAANVVYRLRNGHWKDPARPGPKDQPTLTCGEMLNALPR